MSVKEKVLLVVLDGFGETPNPDPRPNGNAIALAKTPHYERLRNEHSMSLVEACGEAVGLVEGGMGGSEIGHFAIGAGRVVPQTLLQINWAIKDGSIRKNPALIRAMERAENGASLHLLGMLSDAGVHSHIDHLLAMLDWVKEAKIQKCFLHIIGDGRDVQPQSVLTFLRRVYDHIGELGIENQAKFGTVIGRFYAMDRDDNWSRTAVAYNLMMKLEGDKLPSNDIKHLEERIREFYESDAKEKSDYFLPAIVCDVEAQIKSEDAIIFFNYRTDRPQQITAALEKPDFDKFDLAHDPNELLLITFGPYSERNSDENPTVAFPTPSVTNNLGSWLAQNGIPQLRIAETEKYAHVTFFFNSQNDEPYELEDRVMVPSKKCTTFAEIPEMSAREITDEVCKALAEKKHDIVIVNYANADLVGHTGKLEPTVKSIEVLDECMDRLDRACKENGFVFVLTADHGNAEDMQYDDGSERPSHSMNKVPFMIGHYKKDLKLKDGGLADVAPTVLEIMGIEQPKEMTGISLIES